MNRDLIFEDLREFMRDEKSRNSLKSNQETSLNQMNINYHGCSYIEM